MGGNGTYYIEAPKDVYYFDEHRNLYSDNDKFVGDCSFTFYASKLDLRSPHFCVGEVRYWFDDEGLVYGIPYYIDTWQNEHHETPTLWESFLKSESSMDAMEPNLINSSQSVAGLDGHPLGTGEYSTSQVTNSGCGSLLTPCGKVFRRPSSLVEHIYTHTLEKPETCPFPGCKSAFATKPNLRRHFLVHKVGLMKDYKPGTNATLDVIPESNEGGQVNVIRWRKGHCASVAPYTLRA